jgi:hypothetical protein
MQDLNNVFYQNYYEENDKIVMRELRKMVKF